MLEKLYDNIGNKIKNWAVWIFVVETIASIIGGFVLILEASSVLLGILTPIVGTFVAYISTWLLYGFGELIDKTQKNEENTRRIANLLAANSKKEKSVPVFYPCTADKNNSDVKEDSSSANLGFSTPADTKKPSKPHQIFEGSWICGSCGKKNMNRNECWFCKTSLDANTKE